MNECMVGKIIGDIHVTVCRTISGDNFFNLQATNTDVLPILDIIEDTLKRY